MDLRRPRRLRCQSARDSCHRSSNPYRPATPITTFALQHESITRNDSPRGRTYTTPYGVFPSITTILSATADHTQLDLWKARVGAVEAARISKEATERGTLLHLYMETAWGVTLGTHTPAQRDAVRTQVAQNPITLLMVESLYDQTRAHIQTMHATEQTLAHPFLKVAGTCDGIVSWGEKYRTATDNGIEDSFHPDMTVLAILDYKTSRKPKQEQWLGDYFAQSCFYALAANVTLGTTIDHLVIAIAVEARPPQLFVRPIAPYIGPLLRRIANYYQQEDARQAEITAVEARLYGDAA